MILKIKTNPIVKLLIAAAFTLVTVNAWAEWSLDGDLSSIHFSSIKQGTVGEVHSFKSLSGKVTKDGTASVTIDLASVESLIPIRNERMREMLFEIASFPTATVSTQVNNKAIQALAAGETTFQDVTFTLSLHGNSHDYPAKLRVVKLSDNSLMASTESPIMVRAADFKLTAGIEKLREVAGLNSIATAVPVSAKLVYSGSGVK